MTLVSDDISTAAEQLREGLAEQVKGIRDDQDLTPEGKSRRINEAHADASERMDALKSRWREDKRQAADSAMRSAFGASHSAGADAISVRDAEDRVARLESAAEARELLDRAQRNGDTVLSRAIGHEAMRRSEGNFFNHHWKVLLNDYAAANPNTVGSIANLTDTNHDDGFRNALTFMLPRASEL